MTVLHIRQAVDQSECSSGNVECHPDVIFLLEMVESERSDTPYYFLA